RSCRLDRPGSLDAPNLLAHDRPHCDGHLWLGDSAGRRHDAHAGVRGHKNRDIAIWGLHGAEGSHLPGHRHKLRGSDGRALPRLGDVSEIGRGEAMTAAVVWPWVALGVLLLALYFVVDKMEDQLMTLGVIGIILLVILALLAARLPVP